MKNKVKIVALMGKAGAGKDAILQTIMNNYSDEFAGIVSCTTRPMREGEVNGVNYHFLTNEEFAEKLLDGDMIEAVVFNDWSYGTSYDGLNRDKINIGVYNPQGVGILLDMEYDIDLLPIMIECEDKTRLLRQLCREKHPDVHEIIRRFNADEEDFGKGCSQVWYKIDIPANHQIISASNEEGTSLEFLAADIVASIRLWAEQGNK